MVFKKYLTENELIKMKGHQYKSTGYSWLDNKMNPFWVYCANKLPYVMTIS